MTTRRTFLLLAGSGLALAGCRENAAQALATATPDVVLAETRGGLLRFSPTGEQQLGTSAVAGFDGGHLYRIADEGLAQVDPATGATVRTTAVGGGWLPRAVSTNGWACALGRTPAPGALEARPAARARSPLLVAGPGGNREYDLPGVVEPDAFTSDGQGLFVLQWFPATAPDHYRVRRLDLGTGTLDPLLTRDKVPVPTGAEEQMRGQGRQAVLSADGRMLFTLYTHQPGHAHTRDLISGRPGNAHAFVHVLHLDEGWAFCLDLPHPFGEGRAEACALAATERHLAVVDLAAGKLAYASAPSLTLERVVDVPAIDGATASLALTPDGRTVLGGGDLVTVLDTDMNVQEARWQVRGPVRGLGLSGDGKRLYVGGEREVFWVDATTGERLGQVPAPGLTALRFVR